MLIASGSDVLRMSADHVGGPVDDVIHSAMTSPEGDDVTAMAYDSLSGRLYVAHQQGASHYISSVELQPTDDALSPPRYILALIVLLTLGLSALATAKPSRPKSWLSGRLYSCRSAELLGTFKHCLKTKMSDIASYRRREHSA